MEGFLNFYFPCEVTTKALYRARKRSEQCRKYQRRFVEKTGVPGTDMLDLQDYRDAPEDFLTNFIRQNLPTCEFLRKSPYATDDIRRSYHGLREDMLFSKNLSVIVSNFDMSCDVINFDIENISGKIILNVNVENGIGTIVAALSFKSLSTMELIFLKHIFYKRLKVTIKDTKAGLIKDTSFQQYLSDIVHTELCRLCIRHVDYRARYSFTELLGDNSILSKAKEYYGIMNADESFECVSEEYIKSAFQKNLFRRFTRGFYVMNTNALVLHNLQGGIDTYQKGSNLNFCTRCNAHQWANINEVLSDKARNNFRDSSYEARNRGHIDIRDEKYSGSNTIAATRNLLYAEYIRAIELHYQIDKVLSSEIVVQRRSQWNPVIVIWRAYVLWKILYDRAINKYHLNGAILESFEIINNLSHIKEEYQSLQQLIINFLLILLSLLTLIATFIP